MKGALYLNQIAQYQSGSLHIITRPMGVNGNGILKY